MLFYSDFWVFFFIRPGSGMGMATLLGLISIYACCDTRRVQLIHSDGLYKQLLKYEKYSFVSN